MTASYLYYEAFAIAHQAGARGYAFIGNALADAVRTSGMSAGAVASHYHLGWWLHILLVFAFIAYVPHSKYLHMFAGAFNILVRKSHASREIPTLDLEGAETFGIEKAADFGWKDNLDAFACMECGRCQDACPAFRTDKPLSPKMIMVNMEKNLLAERTAVIAKDREAQKPLVPDIHAEDEIWTCTTCGACQHVCPVEIEHIRKIVGMRQSRVLMESKFPAPLNGFFRNLETNANPWGIGFAERGRWAEGLNLRTLAEHPGGRISLLGRLLRIVRRRRTENRPGVRPPAFGRGRGFRDSRARRKNAAAIPPGGWETNISSRRWRPRPSRPSPAIRSAIF